MSGWNLRPCIFPWVHDVLHLPCSTMLQSPNHSRCFWVHIRKYLPWWEAYDIEGGAWSIATLTERQILASELVLCFQSQRSCWKGAAVTQHIPISEKGLGGSLKTKLQEAAIRFGLRTGSIILWTEAHRQRHLSGGSNQLQISTFTVPPAMISHYRVPCWALSGWDILIYIILY